MGKKGVYGYIYGYTLESEFTMKTDNEQALKEKNVGKAQGQVNVKGPRPGTSPVKLARYISKYISKEIHRQPRGFEERRYFCSLGIAVPTERF